MAGLVDQLALSLYYDGRMAIVEEWLGWFDVADLVRFPSLAVFGAWIRALTGRPAEAEWWLSLADGATSRSRSRTAARRSSPGWPTCARS